MRYAIIGASAAGLAGARAILELDPGAEVVLFSDEADEPYCRPLISYWLAREIPEDLFPLPRADLTRADLRLGTRVCRLDPAAKRLETSSGEGCAYDRLLLATGASAARLEIPGEEAGNVFSFRTRGDAEAIHGALQAGARRVVVLGGGLVGVKAAHALAARGASVTLCLASEYPLSQAVDSVAGALVARALVDEGIDVRTGLGPAGFETSGGRAAAVLFASGERISFDLCVVGKGVSPRTELVVDGGRGRAMGVPVDSSLRTPLPDVWAAGDVALTFDTAWTARRLNAVWPMAVEQGTLAGRNMAGAGETYPGGLAMNSLRIGGLELISAGIARAPDRKYEERSALDESRGVYRKVVLRDGRLVGAILAGAPDQAGVVLAAIRRGARLEELPFDPLEKRVHWGRYAFA